MVNTRILWLAGLCLAALGSEVHAGAFRALYEFDGTSKPTIVRGNEAILARDAEAGGDKLQKIAFSRSGGQTVLRADIVKNNNHDFKNTYIRFDIFAKPGYSVRVTKMVVTQSFEGGTDQYFRLGSSTNKKIPDKTDESQNSGSLTFRRGAETSTYAPSARFASANGMECVSLFLTARGMKDDSPSWLVDSVAIEGIYEKRPSTRYSITVSSNIRQQMTFGIDAERLWFWHPDSADLLARIGVKDLDVDYARVAVLCDYELEEGKKRPEKYENVLAMMQALKRANPEVRFFGSPRPLFESYSKDEAQRRWGSDKAPWSPYPPWILEWNRNREVGNGAAQWKMGAVHADKLTQYLADYLNFMHSHGFEIHYLDVVNEKKDVTHSVVAQVAKSLPSKLNPGVRMPLLIAPSAFSHQETVEWLEGSAPSSYDIVGSHNTGSDGSAVAVAEAAAKRGKPAWNTELHGWVGRNTSEDIANSIVLWEHIRAGFSGIDTWLFYGSYDPKDHPMVQHHPDKGTILNAKYEIFKRLANSANRGRYVEVSQINASIPTAAFIKEGVLTLWILNASDFSIENVAIKIDDKFPSSNELEVTRWHGDLPATGETFAANVGNTSDFTCKLHPQTLYCLRIRESDGRSVQ